MICLSQQENTDAENLSHAENERGRKPGLFVHDFFVLEGENHHV
jgi:hypothetical protein